MVARHLNEAAPGKGSSLWRNRIWLGKGTSVSFPNWFSSDPGPQGLNPWRQVKSVWLMATRTGCIRATDLSSTNELLMTPESVDAVQLRT
jgi:hypothetical protein